MKYQHGTVSDTNHACKCLRCFAALKANLTRQVNQLGYRASRHGIQEGDLSSKGGRQQLFKTLLESRPQHVWFSPTCGPWCAWSFLNESQSVAGFQHVQEQRDQHLYQLAHGLVLYRYQCIHQRHLHWEQPARSLMLKTPYLYEVAQGTYKANFDMCQVGGMRDPQNQKLFKKGMEVHTTSQQMYLQFNGRKCNKQHDHQPLEGNTIYKGEHSENSFLSKLHPKVCQESGSSVNQGEEHEGNANHVLGVYSFCHAGVQAFIQCPDRCLSQTCKTAEQ